MPGNLLDSKSDVPIDAIRILFNGDHAHGIPHWHLKLFRDGGTYAEICLDRVKFYKSSMSQEHKAVLFSPPSTVLNRTLSAVPRYNDVIVFLETGGGRSLSTFLLSELSKTTEYHQTVSCLIETLIVSNEPHAKIEDGSVSCLNATNSSGQSSP